MGNWIKRTVKAINEKKGFFTFLRAQFSSQISSWTDFLVSIICVNLFGIFYGNATLIGNVTGGLLNCYINYKWTFKAKGINVTHVLIKFVLVWLVSIFLNRQGTILFTEIVMKWVHINKLPDLVVENVFLLPKIVVSIVVGLVWNYPMQQIFVYKEIDFRKYLGKVGLIAHTTEDKKDKRNE